MATQGPATDRGAKPARGATRPAPVARTRPSGGVFVGVDIGTQAIKAVEVRGFGPGLSITAFGMMNTPPDAIQAGRITDPKGLGLALKSFFAKNGIRGNKVIASVGGADGVVVRVIEVPRMTPSELKEAMRYEVERSIPFNIADVEMDYQAIDDGSAADTTNPNMEVLFAAAQRDLVMREITMYQAAGVEPKAVDIEHLAMGRALIDLSKQGLRSKNVVVVNIGASITEVAVFKNGLLRFPRTIPIAGDNFTRAISDQLGLTMEAAEDEKRQNAAILMEVLTASSATFPGATASPDNPFDFNFDQPATPAPAHEVPGVFNPTYGAATPDDDTTGNRQIAGLGGVGGHTGDTTENAPIGSGDTTDSGIPPQLRGVEDPFAAADMYGPGGGGGGGPVGGAATPAPVPDDPRARRRREIFDALLPVLSEFAMEVRRSVDYFRSRYPSDTVDLILLCGGSARLGNLDQYISYEMGIPTEVADPFKNVNVAARGMSGAARDEVAPAFAIALGLAARDAILGS